MNNKRIKLIEKLFLTIALIISVNLSLFAQPESPVKWKFSTEKLSNNEVALIFEAEIDSDWHLYSQFLPPGGPLSTLFVFEDTTKYESLGTIAESPKPKKEFDEIFGVDVFYFAKEATFTKKIKVLSTEAFQIKGNVSYQVCNDETCIPYDNDFEFSLDGAKSETSSEEDKQVAVAAAVAGEESESNDTLIEEEAQSEHTATATATSPATSPSPATEEPGEDGTSTSLWGFFFFALGLGIAGIFTPCVFPMIPMNIAFFLNYQGGKAKGKFLALFYGLSIIFIYSFIGLALTIIFGPDAMGNIVNHWVTNIIFFLVFIFFASSFFGMFELVLPARWVNKADSQVDKGGLIGTFFMALTLVLVSFSCTAAFIGTILVEAAGGELLKPFVGMFGFSVGFGVPFAFLALFPSVLNKMPKSGGWLNAVKVVFGFVIIAFGMKFMVGPNDILGWGISREVFIGVWIVLFTLLGFYLLGKIKFSHDSDLPYISVPRLILVVIVFSFVIYLVPGLFGAKLQTVSPFFPTQSMQKFDLPAIIEENSGGTSVVATANICEPPKYADKLHWPNRLKGYFNYEQAASCAKELNKPIFIDFTGHFCANCKKMDATTLADKEVLNRLKNDFVLVELYTDDPTVLPESEWYTSDYDGKVMKTMGKQNRDFMITRFKALGTPLYVVVDADGNILSGPLAYEKDISKFVEFLDKGLEEFQRSH
ncbi:MAG: thioredoxin family protein [Bacteroidales bacterium]|nr:thioredoxin family protein [Bacteroidales bacterium]